VRERTNPEYRESAALRRKRKIRTLNFYFTVALLIIIIYSFFLMSLTPFNTACRLCHAKTYESFRASPHSFLRCSTCHSGYYVSSKIDFRFLMISMPGYLIFNGTRKATVYNENCLVCHQAVLGKTTEGKSGVKMSHIEPYQEGYRCAECHSDSAHRDPKIEKGFVDMLSCMKCHNGVKAKKECATCHVKPNYRVEKPYRYRTSFNIVHEKYEDHGRGPLTECSICHSMSYCATCHVMIKKHRVPLPHPEGWVETHYLSTDRSNVRACYACHEKRYCTDCHGIEMPHPENFLKVHTKQARGVDDNKCLKCHEKDGCDFCHTNHRHPGVPADLLKILRRMAGFE
jgi:hypothetical protein